MQSALTPTYWRTTGHRVDCDFPLSGPAVASLHSEHTLPPQLKETAVAKLFEHPMGGRGRNVRGVGPRYAAIADLTVIAGAALAAVVMYLAHIKENHTRRRRQVGPVWVHEQGPGNHDEPIAPSPVCEVASPVLHLAGLVRLRR